MSYSFNVFTGNLDLVGGGGVPFVSSASDTPSIDMTVLAGNISADLKIGTPNPSLGSVKIDLNIQPTGLAAEVDVSDLADAFPTANTSTTGLLTNTDWNIFNNKINSTEKGASNGVATLDGGGKIPSSQLPNSVMEYKGNWNASTNTPTLADGTGNAGDVYRASVAGTTNFGSGPIVFAVGDFAVYSGSIWEKSINSNEVVSVFGRKGVVISANGDYTASQVTNIPAGNIVATTVQAAINELDTQIDDSNTALTNHLNDTVDAHDASAISNVPAGTIAATDVQAALNELDSDIEGHINDTTAAHAASSIAYNNATSGLAATDVQAAITEVHTLSPGDIRPTTFAGANNIVAATNVTNLAFANGIVRGFEVLATVHLNATTSAFESFKLFGIQKASSWSLNVDSVGDNSGIIFDITSAGQVTYTSPNSAGFVALTIKFRAQALTV